MEEGLLAFVLGVIIIISGRLILSLAHGRSFKYALLDSFNLYRIIFDSIDRSLYKIALVLMVLALTVTVIHYTIK